MTPKLTNTTAWQQAAQLMQPALIRVIDNLRKQLEQSDWQGTYDNQLGWPESTSEATKAKVLKLQEQLEQSDSEEQANEIEQQLSQLPQPSPLYRLNLRRQDQTHQVDLWQLCYQICFRDYSPTAEPEQEQIVEIDADLLDERGEVDWLALDDKTQKVIGQIFQSLPNTDAAVPESSP